MQRSSLRPLLVAAALSACTAQPELLNSDRIKSRYGSYGVAIVAQDQTTRRSSLYSTSNGERTSRTYAVVSFVDSDATELLATHARVLKGDSIGSAFREDGWEIRKKTVHIGDIVLADAQHPVARRMQLQTPQILAMHVYELHLEKGSRSLHYASVVESHHPDYLSRDELFDIYPIAHDDTISPERVTTLAALVLAGD